MASNIESNHSNFNNQPISSSKYQASVLNDSSSSSDPNDKFDKLFDLNERNLAMSSMNEHQMINSRNMKNEMMNKAANKDVMIKDLNIDLSNEFDTNSFQTAQDINQQVIQDYVQNYLYNDYKSFADPDTKSMTSIMTSLSTRKTFDFLSKILPALVFLLIVFLMIHFILYVRDIEPLNQLTEIICIALACVVFTLSSAFIMKAFCDKNGAQWTGNPYDSDYLYTRNINQFNNSYVYSNGLLEPCNLASTTINQQPQSNLIKKSTNLIQKSAADLEIGKQQYTNFYIDTLGNRINANQLTNLDKRYPTIDMTNQNINHSPSNQFNELISHNQLINNQSTNQPANPLINQSINQHRRNSSFSSNSSNQRNYNNRLDKKSNQFEQCIQTINGDKNSSSFSNPIKETST